MVGPRFEQEGTEGVPRAGHFLMGFQDPARLQIGPVSLQSVPVNVGCVTHQVARGMLLWGMMVVMVVVMVWSVGHQRRKVAVHIWSLRAGDVSPRPGHVLR